MNPGSEQQLLEKRDFVFLRGCVVMPLPKEIYTAEDYWNLPDGQRAELIDGQFYNMAPPSYMHQKLVAQLTKVIQNFIDAKNGGCEVLPAPFAVNLTGNDKNWVEPDVNIICDKNKLSERGCEGAPDWIIEVISPATQANDYGIKLFKYRSAGVREYWIVNPLQRTVNVFDFENQTGTAQYSFDDSIPVCIFPDLFIKISDFL